MNQTTEQVKATWNGFANGYNQIDSSMQTFYYTLINMLNINSAKHILEIGCGTGKLLPYALSVKQLQTTYLATDLCENMVELTRQNLQAHLQKIGFKHSLQQWVVRQNLTIKALNGEEPIDSPHKFDRIIANLVLMLAQDPLKMMKNLYNAAEVGCLFGISVWGDIQKSNFMNLPQQALLSKGVELPNVRSNFHLFNKMQWLAKESGWQLVVQWQQNAPISQIQLNQSIVVMINFMSKGDQFIKNYLAEKAKSTFAEKKVLNFPVQIAVFRKK